MSQAINLEVEQREILREFLRLPPQWTPANSGAVPQGFSWHRRQALLLRPGDVEAPVLFLVRGTVRLEYVARDSGQSVIELVGAPAVIGDGDAIWRLPSASACYAAEKSLVAAVSRQKFNEQLTRLPNLARHLLRLQAARAHALTALRCEQAFETLDHRFGRLLSGLARDYGLPLRDGTQIRLPLTQSDFASMLGVNRRSVSRVITQWSRQKRLLRQNGRYVLAPILPDAPAACEPSATSFLGGR